MHKIVVLDGHVLNPGDLSWDGLAELGELTVYDRTPADQVAARIGGAAAILTNKTPVTRETLEAAPDLRYIGVLATGYTIVGVEAARAQNIVVTNVPTYGTAAVGQFAVALLLEICHHVGHHSQAVTEGRWTKSPDWCFWDYPLIELAGKTMGIIGLGRIGQATGRIARALGMTVVAHSPHPTDEGRQVAEYVSLDRLFRESDVIALHCPLLPATRGLVNKESIALMKRGVIIINNSRGPLIAEADLAEALNSGQVYAAGLDVVSEEPIRPDNPLLKAKNCFITPHLSGTPLESRRRLLDTAVDNLRQFLAGRPQNVVV
jgi:glycerate dehydrogenase